MKITVSVRGVMLEKPVRDFQPFIETHLKAEPQMIEDLRRSSFTSGLLWGLGSSIVLWSVLSAVAFWMMH